MGVFLADTKAKTKDQKPERNNAKRTQPRKAKNRTGQNAAETNNTRKYVGVIAAIIIVIIFAGAIVYGLRASAPSPQASLSEFEANFNSANTVGVYVTYSTNASFAPAIGCSTVLVQAITGKSSIHKSYNSIHFFVINQTSCTYATLGPNATSLVGSISNCTAFASTHPSIFVNYSSHTKTSITKNALYFYGNVTGLSECGISSEIS